VTRVEQARAEVLRLSEEILDLPPLMLDWAEICGCQGCRLNALLTPALEEYRAAKREAEEAAKPHVATLAVEGRAYDAMVHYGPRGGR